MPEIKVNSPLFVYNDSHLSLKVQYIVDPDKDRAHHISDNSFTDYF